MSYKWENVVLVTDEVLKPIYDILDKLKTNPVVSSKIFVPFEISLSQTYFQYNNQFYVQKATKLHSSRLFI